MARKIKINLPGAGESVSGLVEMPSDVFCLMVLAHGAGAGMEHRFMAGLSACLAGQGIGTLRFNFRYMERGGGRPDYPNVAHQALRAAVTRALDYALKHGVPVVGGGKSFGGRMFSQLAAKDADTGIQALIFYGFPLHAPGKPGIERAAHLKDVEQPMLFLQGTRDSLAKEALISDVSRGLRKTTLHMIQGADHGFHMLKSTGIKDTEVLDRLARETAIWLRKKLK